MEACKGGSGGQTDKGKRRDWRMDEKEWERKRTVGVGDEIRWSTLSQRKSIFRDIT